MADPLEGTGLLSPSYAVSLASVLPSVAATLGVQLVPADDPGLLPLPLAQRAVVVLVDGLGAEQLRRRSGHAPFLRGLEPVREDLTCGYPSTTATSTATLSTAQPPGQHGLVGWQVLMPGQDRLLNHLSWKGGPDPEAWQGLPTVFQRLRRAEVAVTHVGPAGFAGSGLTRAALRGPDYRPAESPQERVEATLAALERPGPALAYLYWGEVDKAGHEHGPDSWEWGERVEVIDAALAQLADRLPAGTSLTVTADHGMVEAPEQHRHDLAFEGDLAAGVRHLGGEPRAPQPYCEPGAAADVLATWREVLADEAVVLSGDAAVEAGWFGPVSEQVRPRIGDLVVAMRDAATVLDSRALRPKVAGLRGHHGSLTPAEVSVPLLHRPAP